MDRKSWDEICESHELQGRWVALQGCAYDQSTGHAKSGAVVDVDDDLVELCARLKLEQRGHCAILLATTHAA
ncbi:MAG: hypothetical protein DRJ42_24815 [Deltaproteobacteria bacterium]|nr:MAG: hypothetical protein DRJ42_24815 [Deltaproteobacteria bacterium]